MKQKFLQATHVTCNREAVHNAITAALQRNLTYEARASTADRATFRYAFAECLHRYAEQYRNQVTERQHLDIIEQISYELSTQFTSILIHGRLRIGTCQKALNLYLKFLWCLDANWPAPLHCPVDRIVLQAAGLSDAWTKLDSIETYAEWITKIRATALAYGASSVAEWELQLWNQNSQIF